MLPGVISPSKLAAPPERASINKSVNTPCEPISSEGSSLFDAVRMVTPSAIAAWLLPLAKSPAAPEKQLSRIIIRLRILELFA